MPDDFTCQGVASGGKRVNQLFCFFLKKLYWVKLLYTKLHIYISPKKIEKLKQSSYQNGRGEAWALENVWDRDQACLFTISVELYIYIYST